MARLTTLKPKLSTLAPRLGHAPGDEKARLREREKARPNWYHSKRWKDLRIEVLKRDHWTCRQTGTICTGRHPAPNSPVVDHIQPHHWDEQLFWDINNLQTVSKAYHDSEKQKQERSQGGW